MHLLPIAVSTIVVFFLLLQEVLCRQEVYGIRLIYKNTYNPLIPTYMFYSRDGANYDYGILLGRCSTRTGYTNCTDYKTFDWRCTSSTGGGCSAVTNLRFACWWEYSTALWTDELYQLTSTGVYLLDSGTLTQLETEFRMESWSLSLTPTPSHSPTPTISPSEDSSRSRTPSRSPSNSASDQETGSRTDSPSPISASAPRSSSPSATNQNSASPTTTETASDSPSGTAALRTSSITNSPTESITTIKTSTLTRPSPSRSATFTHSPSPSPSITRNATSSDTLLHTQSRTNSDTLGDSSASRTFSRTITASRTRSGETRSNTWSNSSFLSHTLESPSREESMTFTRSDTITAARSESTTRSRSRKTESGPFSGSRSMSASRTVSNDISLSATRSSSIAATDSDTLIPTPSPSFTASPTRIESSATVSSTRTVSPETRSISHPRTGSFSRSRRSLTRSASSLLTLSNSPSKSFTADQSLSASQTHTLSTEWTTSKSGTSSNVSSASLTFFASASKTGSRSHSAASATSELSRSLTTSSSFSGTLQLSSTVSRPSKTPTTTVSLSASSTDSSTESESMWISSTSSTTMSYHRSSSSSLTSELTHSPRTESVPSTRSQTTTTTASTTVSCCTGTAGGSASFSSSISAQHSQSRTTTQTLTLTRSAEVTVTRTRSVITVTPTVSFTVSRSSSPTSTNSSSHSPSASLSSSRPTPSLTPSDSWSESTSGERSLTDSQEATATASPSIETSTTSTRTVSFDSSASFSRSAATRDATATASATHTAGPRTATLTPTLTSWLTSSMEVSRSRSISPTMSRTATATSTMPLPQTATIFFTHSRSLKPSTSRSLWATRTMLVTPTGATPTLRETRTASRQCDDFAAVVNANSMIVAMSSTQPYLVHNPQSPSVLQFVIPREIFVGSAMNLTLYFSYPQFLRAGLPSLMLSANGASSYVSGLILNKTSLVVMFGMLSVPSTQSKFIDMFLSVNISRANFACGERWVDLILGISIQAASRALDAASQNALANAAAAATLAGANPGAAATQARTKMLSALVTCSFDLTADNGNSITGLAFGSPSGQYLRGSVVGNWLLFAFFTAGLLLIAFTCARIIHRRHGVPMREAWLSMQCVLHIPSGCLVPLGLVLQPTVSSTVTLIMYPSSSGDAILAAGSIFGCLALVAAMTSISIFHFECELISGGGGGAANEVEKAERTMLQAFLHYGKVFFEGSDQWKTRIGCDPLWKKKYHLIFNDYRYGWYALADLSVSIFMGSVNGVKVDATNGCFVQLCCMLALYASLFLLVLIMRPGISWFAQIFLLLSNVVGLVCCVLIVIGTTTSSDAAFAYSDYLVMSLSIISSVVSLKDIVKLIFLVPIVIRYVVTLKKHSMLKTDEELEEEAQQAVQIIGDFGLLHLPPPRIGFQEDDGDGDLSWRTGSGKRRKADMFSFGTAPTEEMDLRTLPSIPKSGDSDSDVTSVDMTDVGLQRQPPPSIPPPPQHSAARPQARSLWEAMETGAPLPEERTEDPFAPPPSIWRAFHASPNEPEDEDEARRRRRRRKTGDFDDLL